MLHEQPPEPEHCKWLMRSTTPVHSGHDVGAAAIHERRAQHATRRSESCSIPLNGGGAARRADARWLGAKRDSVRPPGLDPFQSAVDERLDDCRRHIAVAPERRKYRAPSLDGKCSGSGSSAPPRARWPARRGPPAHTCRLPAASSIGGEPRDGRLPRDALAAPRRLPRTRWVPRFAVRTVSRAPRDGPPERGPSLPTKSSRASRPAEYACWSSAAGVSRAWSETTASTRKRGSTRDRIRMRKVAADGSRDDPVLSAVSCVAHARREHLERHGVKPPCHVSARERRGPGR